MKRSLLLIAAGVAVAVAAAFVIRAIAGDDNSSQDREQEVRAVERQTTGAYDCMPREVRRRFDVVLRRYDASFREVIDGLPDDIDPQGVDRALRADPDVARLRARARSILLDYVPGGKEFDRACYERATRRYDRRVARREPAR